VNTEQEWNDTDRGKLRGKPVLDICSEKTTEHLSYGMALDGN
jgi:hypothetical protein